MYVLHVWVLVSILFSVVLGVCVCVCGCVGGWVCAHKMHSFKNTCHCMSTKYISTDNILVRLYFVGQ